MPGRDNHTADANRFATTCWSVVLAAGDRDASRASEALAHLCRIYWYPLYAYIRRRGFPADRAQDLTQEFFARLLETDAFRAVDRRKGKFRAFLLAACRHFLANQRDRDRALKRGGGRTAISIDARDAEERYRLEPAHDLTPERLFDRRWALTLLDQALERLGQECRDAGNAERFERLKGALGVSREAPYAALAERLGMTEGAVQVAVHRLRRRYRDLLRAQIAATVGDPAEVDDEIRDLFAALGE